MRLLHFFKDNRLRQIAIFVFAKADKGRLLLKDFDIKKLFCSSGLFLYFIKQIDSMLPFVCSVIDHRRRKNVVRTSVTLSAITSCNTFLFLPQFDVICDLYLNRGTATWNILVPFSNSVIQLVSWMQVFLLSDNLYSCKKKTTPFRCCQKIFGNVVFPI